MPLLSLQNITKDFPGVRALSDVSLDVQAGEVHALVGENGAGKSTLIKIIAGVWTHGSYDGRMLLDGCEVSFHSVRESENSEIRIIHQELSLVNQMTVAENIFLGDEPRRLGCIDYTAMRRGAQQALATLHSSVRPDQRVAELTIGEQQIVEIAKALSKRARVLVLDEPTAALPEKDVENLLSLIRDLRAQGLGIVYISHKLNEVFDIADTVTVLRNGTRVSQYTREGFDARQIVRDMIGRSLETVFPELKPPQAQSLLLLDHVTLPHPDYPDKDILSDVSLSCSTGEVVGIAGLRGSGRTALLSLLFGVFKGAHRGQVRYGDAAYRPASPADAIRRGIALVTEDRKRYGLISTADVRENLCIASLRQFCTHGVIDHARTNAGCARYVEQLNIKTPSIEFPAQNLSGGNQQKVILGRFLMNQPKLLLLDDPTRGIDVGAKYEIYRFIHTLAQQGMGIIFVSSELPEVLGVCHKIVVLHSGKMRTEFGHGEKTEEEVLALAAGV
ncbi:MAG: ATP-binding cassette domain-containing protein [Chitinivibrionales bacterium]|nr:ATP-binding cassette domain-containing protein [Chitinivibrionales bacterium]MBD3396452.1 ATP-binding cassette domain-containing protein [Chitinivibrionales bacterium]